jgi:thiol-disulfide isomerase/thioredoxin
MLRRLCPICFSLALWGCNTATAPPADTTASAAGTSRATSPARRPAQAPEVDPASNSGQAGIQPVSSESEEPAAAGAAPASRQGPAIAKDETDAAAKPAAVSVDSAMMKFRRARTPKARQRAAADLEKALAAEPDYVDGLLFMVQALLVLSDDADDEDEPNEALNHKAVAFLEKTFKADPELQKERNVKRLAAVVYYEDARALAREKKEADSLALLKKAVAQGLPLQEVEEEDDLEAVRKLPGFPVFMTEAQERIRAAAREEVTELLEENKPFKFNFDLEDIAGNKISKAELKGKVLIVDFWGTWCPPCRMEIPHFVALDKEYREKGLQIIGFNAEHEDDAELSAKLVRQFCEKQGVRYPCVLIDDEIIEQVPDFTAFPTTLFIDRAGKVRLKVTGYHDLVFLRTAAETLLSEGRDDSDTNAAGKKGE